MRFLILMLSAAAIGSVPAVAADPEWDLPPWCQQLNSATQIVSRMNYYLRRESLFPPYLVDRVEELSPAGDSCAGREMPNVSAPDRKMLGLSPAGVCPEEYKPLFCKGVLTWSNGESERGMFNVRLHPFEVDFLPDQKHQNSGR